MKRIPIIAALALSALACGKKPEGAARITIDGSSTVYPISEAVAEEFGKKTKHQVTVGISGTGGGFKKFCAGETDISDASRPIKATEIELCKKNGVEYIDLSIAFDGLAVLVNPKNDWAATMTVEELKKLWAPEAQAKITRWSQVREGWPDEEIHLFGPGVDSGTYDYFTEVVVGKEHSSRGDYTSSEDDNMLVQGIATDRLALGFFGFAYYAENKDKLKLVGVDAGKGPILPSVESVHDGSYKPLSRPLFIYVSTKALGRKEVKDFIDFYIDNAPRLVAEVGYVPMPPPDYQVAANKVSGKTAK